MITILKHQISILALAALSASTCALAQAPAAQKGTKQANTATNQTNANQSNGTINASGFSAGLGNFSAADYTLTVYNCLRSGTRVFCDYDATKNTSQQVNAEGFRRWNITLVLGTGRVFGAQRSMYVDTDGSTFELAEITPNAPVRLVSEYDDVPASYTSVTLAFGAKRIQNVPITLIPDGQAANTIPLRQVQNTTNAQNTTQTAPQAAQTQQPQQAQAQPQQQQQQTQAQQAAANNTQTTKQKAKAQVKKSLSDWLNK